jgi:uroporphyrinogen-III decarboxylase
MAPFPDRLTGAPFTLASYAIGEASRNYLALNNMFQSHTFLIWRN